MDEIQTNYVLRRSARAHHIRLKILLDGQLEIVTPVHFSEDKIPDIIHQHRAWIKQAILKVPSRPALRSLPDKICLTSMDEEWTVEYIKCIPQSRRPVLLRRKPGFILVLVGKIDDQAACLALLVKWVRNRAKVFLSECLVKASRSTGLAFRRFSLREQNTRWGSCTAEHAISLNYKLIFLPERLVNHVVLHELSHTRHLDHSPAFWQLLNALDSACLVHRRILRNHTKYGWIPHWVTGSA